MPTYTVFISPYVTGYNKNTRNDQYKLLAHQRYDGRVLTVVNYTKYGFTLAVF